VITSEFRGLRAVFVATLSPLKLILLQPERSAPVASELGFSYAPPAEPIRH
jgi:hypothetical protein